MKDAYLRKPSDFLLFVSFYFKTLLTNLTCKKGRSTGSGIQTHCKFLYGRSLMELGLYVSSMYLSREYAIAKVHFMGVSLYNSVPVPAVGKFHRAEWPVEVHNLVAALPADLGVKLRFLRHEVDMVATRLFSEDESSHR